MDCPTHNLGTRDRPTHQHEKCEPGIELTSKINQRRDTLGETPSTVNVEPETEHLLVDNRSLYAVQRLVRRTSPSGCRRFLRLSSGLVEQVGSVQGRFPSTWRRSHLRRTNPAARYDAMISIFHIDRLANPIRTVERQFWGGPHPWPASGLFSVWSLLSRAACRFTQAPLASTEGSRRREARHSR